MPGLECLCQATSLKRAALPGLARLLYDCPRIRAVLSAPSIIILPALPANSQWEDHMARFSVIRIPATSKGLNTTPGGAIRAAALATTVLATAAPCWAADVTVDRLQCRQGTAELADEPPNL